MEEVPVLAARVEEEEAVLRDGRAGGHFGLVVDDRSVRARARDRLEAQ
jgi:hypothetical protein